MAEMTATDAKNRFGQVLEMAQAEPVRYPEERPRRGRACCRRSSMQALLAQAAAREGSSDRSKS